VRERRVDRHTTPFRSPPKAHEHEHSTTQVEKPFGHNAEALEGVSELRHGPSNAVPAVKDRLARSNLGRLDVLDVCGKQIQVHLLREVERVVASAQPLHVRVRHRPPSIRRSLGRVQPGLVGSDP
jgi:hypothetical protein